MQLFGSDRYYVFPSYGHEFQDMMPRLTEWYCDTDEIIRFWHRFSGGGVLGVPTSHPISGHGNTALFTRSSLMNVYGICG